MRNLLSPRRYPARLRPARAHSARAALALAALALAACEDPLSTDGRAPPPAAPTLATAGACTPGTTITARVIETLGGASNDASDINDKGQIVGSSMTPGGDWHAFLWTAGVARDLGTLGGRSSSAYGINGSAEVVGMSETASGERHAFLWTASSGMVDLGTFGGDFGEAAAINDAGQVVGQSRLAPSASYPPGEMRAFVWTPAAPNGTTGTMQDLGTLLGYVGGAEGSAADINGAGQIVGNTTAAAAMIHAVRWSAPGTMDDLGTLQGDFFSYGEAINGLGEIAGHGIGESFIYRAFFWSPSGGMQEVGTLGAGHTFAWGVSDAGQVVGESDTPAGVRHAYLWTAAGGIRDLGVLPGFDASGADAINNKGQIVGYLSRYLSPPEGSRAVLWTASARCPVAIDVLPGVSPNVIKLVPFGFLPVAVLTGSGFDAALVDPATVTLGDLVGNETPVGRKPGGGPLATLVDVDRDGDLDLLLAFPMAQLIAGGDLTATTTRLVLLGAQRDGQLVRGDDAVQVIP